MTAKRKPKKAANAKGEATEKLEAFGEDGIIDLIAEGKSYREIADLAGASATRVSRYLSANPQRSARAKDARRQSAQAEDDLALAAIEKLGASSKPGDIARAREEAQHRRWRSKVRDPETYGDRVALEHGVQGDTAALMGELATLFGIKKPDDE